MLGKYKKVIIVALVLILGFIVWSIFIKEDPEIDSFVTSEQATEVNQLGEEIIRTLNKIDALELDTSVFNNPLFLRLTDYSKPIEIESVGRRNPFEPLGSGGSNSSSGDNITQ